MRSSWTCPPPPTAMPSSLLDLTWCATYGTSRLGRPLLTSGLSVPSSSSTCRANSSTCLTASTRRSSVHCSDDDQRRRSLLDSGDDLRLPLCWRPRGLRTHLSSSLWSFSCGMTECLYCTSGSRRPSVPCCGETTSTTAKSWATRSTAIIHRGHVLSSTETSSTTLSSRLQFADR